MRWHRAPALTGLLLSVALLAACGTSTRPQADQDRDARFLAAALRGAITDGGSFNLQQTTVLTGGASIPSGQEALAHAAVSGGTLKDGVAQFAYRIDEGQQTVTFDMLIADERLFVKHHGAAASTWKATPASALTTFFPALRLELVRETVLLASSVSAGTITHISAGFAHRYAIRPAADQLEELESVSVQGTAEDQFLKTATAEVDVFLSLPGDRLQRVEVHETGTDPSSGTKQRIDSAVDLRSAKVGSIAVPTEAQQVQPGDVFS